jgi:phosphoribosyl 1,2-cyclic phosphodiesterase
MRLWVLGSGSRGNAVLLDCGESRVLVDAGFPVATLARRLAAIGVPGESIEAAVITHEHTDHLQGACAAARRWGWALYASAGTVEAFPELRDADVRTFEAGGSVTLSTMRLETVRTLHDAADPVAVIATAERTGIRAAVAYDFGCATEGVRKALARLDLLVLEANHDEAMLAAGPYPPSVQRRIGGRTGHLSNRAAAELARACAHAGLSRVVLAHLSDRCNTPAVAHAAVRKALVSTRFRGEVSVAAQSEVLGPLHPVAGRTHAGIQLALDLLATGVAR